MALPDDTDPPSALPRGTRLGEFELRRVLGVGGFGIVYLAFDHALEREVAVKEYMPSSLVGRTDRLQVSLLSQANAEPFSLGLRSFVNEARLLARFDHPSLVKVHRYWEANNTAYMAMPYYTGRNLHATRRQMAAPPAEPWLRGILDPLLGAIERLHQAGVFHRDISPDNIILAPDGHPVLLDFGAARRVLGDKSLALTAILKPAYAPIEQYAETGNVRQGPWTDLYALGATLHYLLLGRAPPPATSRTVDDEMPALAGQALPGCSLAFLQCVDWMLRPRPADRPQSVAALRAALDPDAAPTVIDAGPQADWPRTQVPGAATLVDSAATVIDPAMMPGPLAPPPTPDTQATVVLTRQPAPTVVATAVMPRGPAAADAPPDDAPTQRIDPTRHTSPPMAAAAPVVAPAPPPEAPAEVTPVAAPVVAPVAALVAAPVTAPVATAVAPLVATAAAGSPQAKRPPAWRWPLAGALAGALALALWLGLAPAPSGVDGAAQVAGPSPAAAPAPAAPTPPLPAPTEPGAKPADGAAPAPTPHSTAAAQPAEPEPPAVLKARQAAAGTSVGAASTDAQAGPASAAPSAQASPTPATKTAPRGTTTITANTPPARPAPTSVPAGGPPGLATSITRLPPAPDALPSAVATPLATTSPPARPAADAPRPTPTVTTSHTTPPTAQPAAAATGATNATGGPTSVATTVPPAAPQAGPATAAPAPILRATPPTAAPPAANREPEPMVVQARQLGPSERCEGRVLLALWACIERQCKGDAALREHPECVKLRREQEQRNATMR